MNPAARDRLFNPLVAFDHPATLPLLLAAVVPLLLAPVVLRLARPLLPAEAPADAWGRYRGWLILVPGMAGPVLLGGFWVILGTALLSVLCVREFARVTGLFRETFICYLVLLGVALVHLAALDNWYRLFVALFPLSIAAIAGLAAAQDRPKGYVQRVALGVVAFCLFGSCLGHLSFLATDRDYRPRLALVLVAVGYWDVARYVVGRVVGGPSLTPNTNPGRTVAGAVAGAVVAAGIVAGGGWFVFEGTGLHHPGRLVFLGAAVAVAAQLGDLMLGAIKRDAGVEQLDPVIPGHGGLLDRFDSLILVAPVAFHVVNLFAGIGPGEPPRVFTSGW